jgi:HSP20 family protein
MVICSKTLGQKNRIARPQPIDMEFIMARLSVYDPFADVFPELFRGFLQPARGLESATTQEMRIEVRESANEYQVFAELAGVRKDDISVQIDGNRVSISAEVKREVAAETAERVLRNERFYGTLARSFALAHELDEAGAQARFDNGVLILTLPKAQAPAARKLVIN